MPDADEEPNGKQQVCNVLEKLNRCLNQSMREATQEVSVQEVVRWA